MRGLLLILLCLLSVPSLVSAQYIGAMGTRNPETSVDLVDEFIGGSTETGEIGDLGWIIIGGTVSNTTATLGRPGIRNIDTGATINTISGIRLATAGAVNVFDVDELFDLTFMVNPNMTTAQEIRVGVNDDGTAAPSAGGIYFEHDTAAGDFTTTWVCVTRASSSSTRTNTTITVSAGTYYKMRIRRLNATTIEFYLNGTLRCTHTATVPTNNQAVLAQIENTAAASKTVDVDYFRLRINGLPR